MKSIYFADPMHATPFQEGPRRAALRVPNSVRIVESAEDADVIVARTRSALADYFELDRQYYVWTHEPVWSPVASDSFLDAATGKRVHVSTAWNGDIYLSPLYYFPFYRLDADEVINLTRQKTKACVALSTYRQRFDRYQDSVNVDLSEHRQRIAIGLQRDYDYCDILGRSWPNTVTILDESRGPGWQGAKQAVLKDYAFNLAFENTLQHNYVTEKLWDAYRAGCVPLYFGRGSGIESVLRDGSYVDCSSIHSLGELHKTLSAMSVDDRVEILRSALADLERISATTTRTAVVRPVVARFFERIMQF